MGFGACLVAVEEGKISYYPCLYFPKTFRAEILFVVVNTYVMQGTSCKDEVDQLSKHSPSFTEIKDSLPRL